MKIVICMNGTEGRRQMKTKRNDADKNKRAARVSNQSIKQTVRHQG